MEKRTLVLWVIGGAVAGIAVIFVAIRSGVVVLPSGGQQQSAVLNAPAPAGVSYDQKDAYSATSTSVVTGAPSAPSQSLPVESSKIPDAAIKLSIQKGAFTPSSFSVKAGQTVVLSLTSTDAAHGHSLVFIDPSLADVSVGVGPDETRVITFIAPEKAGNYKFQCNVFGDAARGETGVMVVK